MKRRFYLLFLSSIVLTFFIPLLAQGEPTVINVTSGSGNDCEEIRKAVAQVKALNGAPSVIKFTSGTYHLKRNQASVVKYYISNTMSWSASPDNMKYIGIYLKDISNLTIDATGARFVTHGEITSLVTDGCENITFKNLVLDAADPSLTEMTIESMENDRTFVFKVHETSNFEIAGTTLRWKGEGWSFTGGPAQIYDPIRDISWRSWNPQSDIQSVADLGDKRLRIVYNSGKEGQVGYTFQMRDGVRDQVAGFILKSKNVHFEGVKMHFLGNFGVVCQYSDGLTFSQCDFAPDPESGRTSAGFADFLQVSGCKGVLKVEDCKFQGAHDDPINVHGTYLKILEYVSPTKVKVQFQHHESWGFEAFFVGDKIELIDAGTMLSVEEREVKAVTRIDDRNMYVEFDAPIVVNNYSSKTVVIENISWTPEVEIRRCHFSRVPTRGVLLTTRGRSVIEDNTFYKMQMAGIYVSGDASSWYESGKVQNLTIRRNKFVECGNPVIFFDPTNSVNGGQVHSNVTISDNEFYIKSGQAVGGKSVNNLSFTNNTIYAVGATSGNDYCSVSQSANVVSTGNVCVNPKAILLKNALCTASSNQVANPPLNAIDGNLSTSWRPISGDTEKYLIVRLPNPSKINRIDIVSANNSAMKYRIKVSNDSTEWKTILDCTDNLEANASRSHVGCFGESIRYVRIEFTHAIVNISEIRFFGGDSYLMKEGLISGVVIGTSGSWNNVLSSTKEAVFDFDTDSFFDAPTSIGWVGLDFGKESAFRVDSIKYVPRSNDEGRGRMVGGRFQLANKADFSDAVTVFTVSNKPEVGYNKVSVSNSNTFRYARYICPENGFCNISELEFYGVNNSTSSLDSKLADKDEVKMTRWASGQGVSLIFPRQWQKEKQIKLYSLEGKLLKTFSTNHSQLSIPASSVAVSVFFASVESEGIRRSVKIIL